MPKTKELLDEFYKPYNEELAELMNDKRFLFPPPPPPPSPSGQNKQKSDDSNEKPQQPKADT